MKKLFTYLKSHIKAVAFVAVNVLLLILIGICLWQCGVYSNSLRSQQAAEAWKGASDLRFGQVSAFMPVNALADENAVFTFRSSLEKKLAEAGVETTEETKLWTDAYSISGKLSVKSNRIETEVTSVAVGGNFFLFHPYYLMSGSYLSESDLMKDRVVLDYELAWKLFGSASLEGMTVEIAGKPYYVAGVIQRESDKFSKKTFNENPMMFLSYSTYGEILGEKATVGIDCYELAIHEPITGFAKSIIADGFPVGSGAVVDNSSRFSFSKIFDIFKNFGDRSIQKYPVVYPYWENAARVAEVNIARLWVVIAILAVLPFICLAILAIRLISFIIRKIKQGAHAAYEAWDDRYGRIESFKEKHPGRKAKALRKESEEPSEDGEEPHKKRKKLRKKTARAKPEIEAALPPLDNVFNETDVSLDIESIVREIMNDSKQEK